MKRFFLGIPLSEGVKDKVKPIVKELQESKADIRLVALENLHFTVKFLGEMDEERVPEIDKKVKELQISSFSFQVVGVGFFPSLQKMQTIWVGTESKELKSLLMKVNRALSYLRKEQREEVPHATLARVKSGRGKEEVQRIVQKYAPAEFGEMRVEKIILYASELRPEGPVYKAVKEISLENKA